MPRPGPRRPSVTIRMSEAGRAAVDLLAAEAGLNRSEVARQLLAHALASPVIVQRVKAGRR